MTTTNHGPFGPNGERPPGWPPPPFDPPGEPLPYVPPPDPPGSSSEPRPIGGPRTGMASGARAPDRSVGTATPAKHHLAAATSASSIPSATWLPLARQLATWASRPRCETTEATRRKRRRRQ